MLESSLCIHFCHR